MELQRLFAFSSGRECLGSHPAFRIQAGSKYLHVLSAAHGVDFQQLMGKL